METNHTQGEWNVSKTVNDFTIHSTLGGFFEQDIALVYQNSRSTEMEEAEANAKLIAAAPELLKALDLITRCAKMKSPLGTYVYFISDAAMQEAQSAVQKAKY